MDTFIRIAQEQGMKLLGGIIVLIIGFILVRWVMKFLTRNDRLSKIEPTIKGFLMKLLKVLLYIIVILTAANVMGIPLTSFVALLGSAGVAVSLAMQGALSNMVGGLTLLLLKPFKLGDYVKIGDTEGTVLSIGTFFTEFTTPDNRHISLPNSSLTNTAIVNYSWEGTRRLDVNFGVSYDADIDHTVRTLQEAVSMTGGILDQPAPVIKLIECADSSLVFMIRVWCNSQDYFNVNWDLTENGKRMLDKEGIEIPYPQMDVHMK
jgi:small conductance mechanosensitive channel